MSAPPKSSAWLVGFESWLSFARATIGLGVVIVGGVVWAMDDRYVKHEDLQAAVTDIKETIQSSAREVQCEALLDDIQRLEQTIAFKSRTGEDASLERIILDSDKRKLAQYGGCPQ